MKQFYATTMNHISVGLQCAMKSVLYMTTGDGWTEKKLQYTSQSQTYTKNWAWSLFGGLLPVWLTTAFWTLVKPLHLRSILTKWMIYAKSCNACSQHWSTERVQFFSTTTPDCMSENQCFKSWMNCPTKFCLLHHIFTCSLANWLQASLQLFAGEMFSRSSLNLKAWSFTLQK